MLQRIAIGAYALDCLFLVSFAAIYLLRPRVMPYHLQAMGRDWDDVPAPIQFVLLALMRAAGSASAWQWEG